MSQYIRFPESVINANFTAEIVAALQTFFPDDIVGSGLYNDCASNNITASYTEVAGSAAVPAGTKKIQVSSIVGAPIKLGIAANAGAAASAAKQVALVAGGGPVYFEYTYVAGEKIFMKTLDGSTVADGNFVINFLG